MTPEQTKKYFEAEIDALCKRAEEMDNLIFDLAEAVDCCGKKWTPVKNIELKIGQLYICRLVFEGIKEEDYNWHEKTPSIEKWTKNGWEDVYSGLPLTGLPHHIEVLV